MRRAIVAIAFILAWAGPCPAQAAGPGSPGVRSSGFVMDGNGLPLTGTFLLDFRFRDPAGRGELWRESIYVEAVEGVFHADLGKVRPLPRSQSVTGDMVEVSAPAGSGWVVRPMAGGSGPPSPEARAVLRSPEGAAAPPRSSKAQAVLPPPEGTAASREILQLQKELQRAKAEIEAQKSAVRPSVYEVQPGDTLRSIAEKVFGNAEQWVDLYQANDDRLLRGGDLVPGQKLIIPRDVPGANRRQ